MKMLVLLGIFCMLLSGCLGFSNPLIYPPDRCGEISEHDRFDFIVVGAGTAGAAVAGRLSEIPEWNILLLEGGSDPSPLWSVPSLATMPDDDIAWGFKYAPSREQCLGMNNAQCDLHRARVLGGCSVVNLMLYVRGNRRDYDEWAELGCNGWSYRDVLPYFRKLENYEAYPITDIETNFSVSATYHRRGGPVSVNLFPFDPFTEHVRTNLFAAADEIGYRRLIDFNGANMMGVGNSVANIDGFHLRVNSAKAYLRHQPPNLVVCKNAVVSRVLFDQNRRAEGVEFTWKGTPKRNFVTKEIILSAGAISTPPILERSGVGQPALIRRLGVELVQNLPGVGENLQDVFLMLGNAYALNSKSIPLPNPFALTLSDFLSFFNTTYSDGDIPDILIQPLAFPKLIGSLLFQNFGSKLNYKKGLIKQYSDRLLTKDMYIMAPAVLRQGSRGSVHSYTDNPFDELEIIGNHYTDYTEINSLIRGARIVETFFNTDVMQTFEPEFIRIAECEDVPFGTDEYWICMMRTTGSTLYHPVGTCKMGADNDPDAVVDARLRVLGVDGLRVIDASIMPVIPRGHTNVPTFMIGELGADFIKHTWIEGYQLLPPIDDVGYQQ